MNSDLGIYPDNESRASWNQCTPHNLHCGFSDSINRMSTRRLDEIMDSETSRSSCSSSCCRPSSDFFVLTGLTPFLLLFDVPLVALLAWMWIAMHRSQTT